MNTRIRIAMACFLGGAIGALIAIQLGVYLWWVGVLTGGLVGYLSYEFKKVAHALCFAGKMIRTKCRYGFSIDVSMTSIRRQAFGFVQDAMFLVLVVIICSSVGTSWMFPLWFVRKPEEPIVPATIMFVFAAFLIGAGLISATRYHKWIRSELEQPKSDYVTVPLSVFLVSPVGVLFYWLPLGIFKVLRVMPSVAKFLWKVARKAFLLIHSEIRLLCFTDALIGAIVGYFCGSALIGGMAGAVSGLVNYELISKRWLKLVPA